MGRRPQFQLIRSWNFYRYGYGTLSLWITDLSGQKERFDLFHWRSEIGILKEVDFRKRILDKLSKPPFLGIRGYITRCVYMYWDKHYPTRVKLFKPTRFQLSIGKWVASCIIEEELPN